MCSLTDVTQNMAPEEMRAEAKKLQEQYTDQPRGLSADFSDGAVQHRVREGKALSGLSK